MLTHIGQCSAGWDLDAFCTCGLQQRIQLQTEQNIRSAWMKRANEAEAELATAREVIEAVQFCNGGFCPVCRGGQKSGHGASCDIGRALATQKKEG